MEKKRFSFEVKQVDVDAGTFEGHASIFGIPDDGQPPDVMQPGAFARTIREWGPEGKNRIKILAQHRSWDLPIGKPLELREDETGLFVKGKISDTDLGRDVLTLLRDGVLTELSIGFETLRADFDKQNGLRRVHEVRLFEISPVTWAMHPDALITTIKESDDPSMWRSDEVNSTHHQINRSTPFRSIGTEGRSDGTGSTDSLRALPGEEPASAQQETIPPPAAASGLEQELVRSIQTLTANIKACVGRKPWN